MGWFFYEAVSHLSYSFTRTSHLCRLRSGSFKVSEKDHMSVAIASKVSKSFLEIGSDGKGSLDAIHGMTLPLVSGIKLFYAEPTFCYQLSFTHLQSPVGFLLRKRSWLFRILLRSKPPSSKILLWRIFSANIKNHGKTSSTRALLLLLRRKNQDCRVQCEFRIYKIRLFMLVWNVWKCGEYLRSYPAMDMVGQVWIILPGF